MHYDPNIYHCLEFNSLFSRHSRSRPIEDEYYQPIPNNDYKYSAMEIDTRRVLKAYDEADLVVKNRIEVVRTQNNRFGKVYQQYIKAMEVLGKTFNINNLFSDLLNSYLEKNYRINVEDVTNFFEKSLLLDEKNDIVVFLSSIEHMSEEFLDSLRKDIKFMKKIQKILKLDENQRKLLFHNMDYDTIAENDDKGLIFEDLEAKVKEYFSQRDNLIQVINRTIRKLGKSSINFNERKKALDVEDTAESKENKELNASPKKTKRRIRIIKKEKKGDEKAKNEIKDNRLLRNLRDDLASKLVHKSSMQSLKISELEEFMLFARLKKINKNNLDLNKSMDEMLENVMYFDAVCKKHNITEQFEEYEKKFHMELGKDDLLKEIRKRDKEASRLPVKLLRAWARDNL